MIIHTPSFNENHQIEDFVNQIAVQTKSPQKIVLHDDASNDSTVQTFQKACLAQGIQHQIHISPRNTGLVRNLRKLLITASSQDQIFALLSNHEKFQDNHLAVLEEGIMADPSLALCYSDSYFRSSDSNELFPEYSAPDLDTVGLDRVESFTKVLKNYTVSNALWGSYRPSHVSMSSPFPFGRGGDHAFLAGIALTGPIRFIKQQTWTRIRERHRSYLHFATLENCYREKGEIEEVSKWPWLGFWQSHYEVLCNSAISNSEKVECIRRSVHLCQQKSSGKFLEEINLMLTLKKGPVSMWLTAKLIDGILN